MKDTVLEEVIEGIFSVMTTMTEGGDLYMAQELAKAIKSYLLTAITNTVDAGTVAETSVYAGKGTGVAGSYVIDSATLQSNLYSVFTKNKVTNDEIADGIANAVNTACTKKDAISINTVGTLTLPNGASSNYSGTGKGTFSGDKTTIASSLKSVFTEMNKKTSGGDAYFAKELAKAIGDYIRAGNVTNTLDDPITGSGSGKITLGSE